MRFRGLGYMTSDDKEKNTILTIVAATGVFAFFKWMQGQNKQLKFSEETLNLTKKMIVLSWIVIGLTALGLISAIVGIWR